MKSLWNSFKIAFAMFSKIPMPQAEWTKENMKYMFCFFPVIGAVIAAAVFALDWISRRIGIAEGFRTVILVLVPVFITGGIHVDGLLDTADALSSWQERERRLEILKDSHAGAFAVIAGCVYFLCCYGAYSQIGTDHAALCVVCLVYVVSRCFSGLGVVLLPKAKESGTVAEFSRKAEDRPVRNTLIVYLVILAAAMLRIHPVLGGTAFLAAFLIFLYYRHMALKFFGGTTGDLSGFFLCVCEAGTAVVIALVSAILHM
ncbi:MAG TPA: adenosylcobinamide-GDP ribazoletransferase [Candidatus Blautia excrementipullorum]|nr:adenosylcobinamide-GDP ribazoletransferase [Candidatus Blautia excrementipullorum]